MGNMPVLHIILSDVCIRYCIVIYFRIYRLDKRLKNPLKHFDDFFVLTVFHFHQ